MQILDHSNCCFNFLSIKTIFKLLIHVYSNYLQKAKNFLYFNYKLY